MKLGNFHSKEFTGMLYNPERVPEGTTILEYYKDLNRVKEFSKASGPGLNDNVVMLFILCMYDKESPYRKKFPDDALKRKLAIAHDIGWTTTEGGVFDIPVQEVLKGKNSIVNKKIVEYIRIHRSYAYSFQVSTESAYANLMLEVQSGNVKNLDKLRELKDELEKNLIEMLNQDNNPFLKDEVLRDMEEGRLGLRPEDYAKRAREGKPHPKPRKTISKYDN